MIDYETEFDEMIQEYLEAFNSGDFRRVASFWAEDAIHLPPIGGEIRGRSALEEFYKEALETMQAKLSDYEYECRFVSDHVIVRESWKVSMNSPDQGPVTLPGRGMWVGRREGDGVWRAFWALARVDQPSPA
jgi:uncharacterized protein (TIGR02246 family)